MSELVSDQWIAQALAEDMGTGDKTTLSTIDPKLQAIGRFLAKQDLVCCAIPIVIRIFHALDPSARVAFSVQDGDKVSSQEVFGEVKGPAHVLLQAERVALNVLQRLCGIATLAFEYSNLIKDYKTKILDTRKTLPHYRALEKYAVRCGGGHNHRMGLDDQMMIKDNHITANFGDVGMTAKKAKMAYPGTPLIIEISERAQIDSAIKHGADRLLLDNMSNAEIQACMTLVNSRVPIEVSGGITKERLISLAQLDVDFISVGAITHSATAADISMKIATSVP